MMTMGDWLRMGRVSRFFMYLLFAFAGVLAWWNSLTTLQEAGLEYWSTRVWATFLLIGGLLGVLTALTDRWIYEYCGLVLLGTVFATFGLSVALISTSLGRLAFAAIFLGFAFSCAVRWKVINRFKRTRRVGG